MMKDEVLNEIMDTKKFIKERINKNKNLFSIEELNFLNNNAILIEKIYFLGVIDSNIDRN